jgi:hypothetical protein
MQEKIAIALFEMIDSETGTDILKAHVQAILNDKTGSVLGAVAISDLVRTSSAVASDVLATITELAPNISRQSAVTHIQRWIAECSESSEIPVSAIASAIYAALDHNYGPTASGKKRAESALSWAQKLIKKIQREIPRDIFGNLADKFIATGSRNAATMIRQIANLPTHE